MTDSRSAEYAALLLALVTVIETLDDEGVVAKEVFAEAFADAAEKLIKGLPGAPHNGTSDDHYEMACSIVVDTFTRLIDFCSGAEPQAPQGSSTTRRPHWLQGVVDGKKD